jgi:hypothetical protein
MLSDPSIKATLAEIGFNNDLDEIDEFFKTLV